MEEEAIRARETEPKPRGAGRRRGGRSRGGREKDRDKLKGKAKDSVETAAKRPAAEPAKVNTSAGR